MCSKSTQPKEWNCRILSNTDLSNTHTWQPIGHSTIRLVRSSLPLWCCICSARECCEESSCSGCEGGHYSGLIPEHLRADFPPTKTAAGWPHHPFQLLAQPGIDHVVGRAGGWRLRHEGRTRAVKTRYGSLHIYIRTIYATSRAVSVW